MELFSQEPCELGEGPVWHPTRQALFWLDIPNKWLYEKHFYSRERHYDQKWDLPSITSALAICTKRDDVLWMVTEKSFGRFILTTGEYMPVVPLVIADGYRPNDGGVAPDGSFWFGIMETHPSGCNGQVFSISADGTVTKQLDAIGIPNTFCWSTEGVIFYLSDSLTKQMYSYSVEKGKLVECSKRVHLDLTGGEITPDGGAVDVADNIWNAQWGGARVACYDSHGQQVETLAVPVSLPTSCCIGGPDNRHLFVTSAKEKVSGQASKDGAYPGGVYCVELKTPGLEVNSYCFERS